jgi:bifunctional DNA-binding transcriptional regulator/antitoxin component of YhaV-PrlF toxin-antitoxin module
MNPVAEALISTVITEWTDASYPFTAYQVSREVQRRMKAQGHAFIRHNDLKNSIHKCQQLADASEYGDYTHTLVPVAGTQAVLYHPNTFDASTWTPTTDAPSPVTGGSAHPVTTPTHAPAALTSGLSVVTPTDASDGDDDGAFVTDYRGRLMVPKQYLSNLGLNAGSTVYVISETNELVLSASQIAASGKSRLVERNGDIRVLTTELQAAGLTGNKFNIEMADRNGVQVVSVKAA